MILTDMDMIHCDTACMEMHKREVRSRRIFDLNLCTRRGSYIMEAAIVLPVIIFVLITVVLIVMFFYSQMTERSRMHTAMRAEAGLAAGTTVYTADNDSSEDTDAEIYTEKTLSGSEVVGKKYLIMKYRGVLEKKGIFVVKGKCSASDGARYVRYQNLIKGIVNETQ